jgi:hypothetical protein
VNQEFYNRNTTDEQIRNAQSIFRKLGLESSLQLIWDDPVSEEEDKDAVFRLVMDLERPFNLYLFGLTIYPNTHLARRLLREGLITEADIEGVGTHAFEQFRVDLNYPRPKADQRWLALLVLANKPFLSKEFVWKLYESERFKRDPRPLTHMATASNLAHMAGFVGKMAMRGEVTPLLIKRWVNPGSLVTM